jgi:SAM-dependent methyltransferase
MPAGRAGDSRGGAGMSGPGHPGAPAPLDPPADHYSYTVYADPAMADRFDAMRFSGPVGTLLAESQERVLTEFLGAVEGRRILDVGTGTGRAALAIARRGAEVVGIDASAEMLRVARARAEAQQARVTFDTGDAHQLAFPDRSFSAAVSLRVLMHTPDWRRCLAELCRVSQERVVFDYPAAASAAALQSAGRHLLARLGSRVEAYRVMRGGAIRAALRASGFEVERVHKQFVLPIALHKAVNSRAFTLAVEDALAAVGLLRLFGSPVTVVAVRCEPS